MLLNWVRSAIKHQHDRYGTEGCLYAKQFWDDKCQHYKNLEIHINWYRGVDLDQFQAGVLEERGNEEHTFILYRHKDLQQTNEKLSAFYHMPLLPGTDKHVRGNDQKVRALNRLWSSIMHALVIS